MSDYAASLYPDHWRVVGVKLHPFCVGHALLLHRLDSPFARPDIARISQSRVGDMATFLAVARRPYPRAKRLVEGRHLVRFIIPITALRLLTRKAQQSLIVGAYQYLCHAWTPPQMWKQPRNSGATPHDTLAFVVSTLRGLGVPLDAVLTTHLRQAIHDACLHLASMGQVELMDAGDEEMIRQAEVLEAELRSKNAQG